MQLYLQSFTQIHGVMLRDRDDFTSGVIVCGILTQASVCYH
jgi:hypothetical protein